MKKNILALVGLVIVLGFSSCSGYDEDFLDLPPVEPTTEKNDSTPSTPHDDTWETTKSDWFEMPTTETILSYKKTNLKDSYMVEVPFAATLGQDLFFSFDKKSSVSFKALEDFISVTPSYGEWYGNNESDSIRTITTSQNFDTNVYTRTLSITTGEAKRMLNGKPESFLMPTLSFSSVGTSRIDSIRTERNDSIIDRLTYRDSVVIKFVDRGTIRKDLKPYVVSSKTIIECFVGKKEKNENMPEPTFRVDGEILWISDRTASPIYKNYSKKDQGADWFEVSVIKTTKKTYTVVNGVKKDSYDNSQLADATWNSCMYDAGYTNKWVPCMITPNTGGWVYTLQFSDGTYRAMDVAGGQALIDGLKSFKKDNNAEQTPFLTKGVVKRTFTNGDLYTVNGSYPYTVAAE